MDSKKRLNSDSGDNHTPEKTKIKTATKCNSLEEKSIKECLIKDGLQTKGKCLRPSMIPVIKIERPETKCILHKNRHCSVSKLSCTSKAEKQYEDFEYKMKLLEEKEKSIAEYYLKIENMIRKFLPQKDEKEYEKVTKRKTQNPAARKLTSDPLVFGKGRLKNEMLLDFESNVQQISDIWLKTSADLSNAMKNLKKNASFDSVEFEIENVRIQLALKQAKSLTLIKTRNVIEEAKKLFYNRDIIRTELEKLLSNENLKLKCGKCQGFKEYSLDEKEPTTSLEDIKKQDMNGIGDSSISPDKNDQEIIRKTISSESCKKNSLEKSSSNSLAKNSVSEEKESCSGDTSQNKSEAPDTTQIVKEIEIWAKELAKKNETITNLNNKVFELQKTCNEHSHKYNLLQVKLYEFHEKIQWNHVLWKQIGKLKEQVKSLQQSNKLLESQKRELEFKISKLDQELERLIKLNHLLNQKKYLLNVQEIKSTECRHGEETCKVVHEKCYRETETCTGLGGKLLAEKQNAINQLKTILSVMKNQEDFAQKQISMFQSKIEELEKNAKA